ncbi:MAG TPA: RNA polymerase sigma factor [Actinomycetota bacterium]|nr:RNA polymerase sigma factor [Actinomycetota bacterium]
MGGIPPFPRFLEEHRADVYRFLLAAVGPHDADDCFQETFLSALRAYPTLRNAANLRGWVLTIATRKALDHWRARSRRPMPIERLPERAAPEPPDGDPALWRAVGDLPPMQRAAVVHRYVLDLPYAQVAAALGCSEEAARASAAEGRRKLRALALAGEETG